MADIDLLQLRIHSVLCEQPTARARESRRPDRMVFTSFAIDETGDLSRSPALGIGEFEFGTLRQYYPPIVIAQFELNEVSFYPRVLTALNILTAQGTIGEVDDGLARLLRTLASRAVEELGRLTERELGRILSSAEIGRLSASVVTGITSEVTSTIFRELGHQTLEPGRVQRNMDSADDFAPDTVTPEMELAMAGAGGGYVLRYSWARSLVRTASPSEDLEVSALEITMQTGEDDLRDKSLARLSLTFTDGEAETDLSLNYDGWGMASDSLRRSSVRLSRSRQLSTFESFCVRHISVIRGFPHVDHPDNWDLQSLIIRYVAGERSGVLFSRLGLARNRPIHRFSDSEREFCVDIVPAAVSPDRLVTLTGADSNVVVVTAWESVLGFWAPEEAGGREIFSLVYLSDGRVALRGYNDLYVTPWRQPAARAVSIGPQETFELIRYPEDGRILLRSASGGFLERNRRHPHSLGLHGHSVDEWSMFSLTFL